MYTIEKDSLTYLGLTMNQASVCFDGRQLYPVASN